MIIVSNKNIENTVYFPQNIVKNTANYHLILENRASNKKYEFDVEDKGLVPNDFYTFFINFKDLKPDEYEYELTSDGEIMSKGIIKLCEEETATTIYNKNNEYTIYEQ